MILSDHEILNLSTLSCIARSGDAERMITPFVQGGRRPGVISYGASSFGYDIRLAPGVKWLEPRMEIVDPKDPQSVARGLMPLPVGEGQHGHYVTMPPHSFALGSSVEKFKMPDDVLAICVGKSTYARCGLVLNVTPVEPGWEGYLTLELSNTTPRPVRVYLEEGIGQLIFLRGRTPSNTYAQKNGKYQGQQNEITLPRVD